LYFIHIILLLQAKDYVICSSALQRTHALAQAYAEKANQVLEQLLESEVKNVLEVLTERVIG
jgi:hexaprenyl-diphosphate synthase